MIINHQFTKTNFFIFLLLFHSLSLPLFSSLSLSLSRLIRFFLFCSVIYCLPAHDSVYTSLQSPHLFKKSRLQRHVHRSMGKQLIGKDSKSGTRRSNLFISDKSVYVLIAISEMKRNLAPEITDSVSVNYSEIINMYLSNYNIPHNIVNHKV